MINLNMDYADPQWFTFPENAKEDEPHCKLLIRAYPESMSEMTIRKNDATGQEFAIKGIDRKKRFIYCLVDAEGIGNSSTKKELKIKDNDKIKEYIFDYCQDTGIPSFVELKGWIKKKEEEEIEKN